MPTVHSLPFDLEMTFNDLEIIAKIFATLSLPLVPSLVTISHSLPFDLEMTSDDLEIITKIFATLTSPHSSTLVPVGLSVKI